MSRHHADLILHPVRLRIVTELAGRQMTPRQLASALPDIPQSTLYRQISALAEGGVLEVVAEQSVNGATERTYALVEGGGRLSPDDMRSLSTEEHVHFFTVYAASLIEAFAQSVQSMDISRIDQSGMAYSRGVVHLSDAERAEFQQRMNAVVAEMLSRPPSPERTPYTIAMVVLPTERKQS
jgi:DNA-binding transcriptional ArsR family regulator